MKIYGLNGSTCTRKVLMTLKEKDATYEFITVHLNKGEHKQPEHLARHPFGVIPVLDDNGFVLYESRAIIHYLDKRLPGYSLTPSDLKLYGRMEQWINIEQAYFSPPAITIIKQVLWGNTPDKALVTDAIAKISYVLDVTEKHLTNQSYLAGEAFSLADISWLPYLAYLMQTEYSRLITERPQAQAWWQRISQRPTWQQVII